MSYAKLSPLAPNPDWSKLNIFQQTITKADFVSLLDRVYAPNGAWRDTITIHSDGALITTGPDESPFFLRFATSRAAAKPFTTYWRARGQLPAEEPDAPLAGMKIALDPGHLGGPWAKMEERWFQIGTYRPVAEGDMTLLVAKLLSARLKALGAQVYLTHNSWGPTTNLRPNKLVDEATKSLTEKSKPVNPESVKKESELLFYRVAEIRRRAIIVNETIRPDLVICLHFNAEEWGDPNNPKLTDVNHLHFLVAGSLSADELAYEDQRYEMLYKLLSRSFVEEAAVTDVLSKKLARATGLPPYVYEGSSASRINGNAYVWARNLLANRLYTCPVAYAEPYVMNSRSAFARIQMGDYSGYKEINGTPRKSIFREYADAIADGVLAYYSGRAL